MIRPATIDYLEPHALAPAPLTLAATFPAEPLVVPLRNWLRVIGSTVEIDSVSVSSPVRYVLDPTDGLHRRACGVHLILFRVEDWNHCPACAAHDSVLPPDSQSLIERNASRIIEAVDWVADSILGTVLIVVCPCAARYSRDAAAAEFLANIEQRLRDGVAAHGQFRVIGVAEGMRGSRGDGRGPTDDEYSTAFFEFLARTIARAYYAAESRPWRVLVLSPGGVSDVARWRAFVASQWRAGRLVVSTVGDAPGGLAEAEQWSDAGAAPPAQRVAAVARRLSAAHQDMVFLGDLQACSSVTQALPDVSAIPVFENSGEAFGLLSGLWCLDDFPETWSTEPESMIPTLPRLGSDMLLRLARHRDAPPQFFLGA